MPSSPSCGAAACSTASRPAQTVKGSTFANTIRLVLRAGWRLPALLAVLDLLAGAIIAVELLIVRDIVGDLVDAGGSVATSTMLQFAVVVAIGRLVPAVSRDLQALVTEGVQKVLVQDVVARAALAPFEKLESPDFQDQLVRAQAAASGHVWEATSGALLTMRNGIASASLVVVLLSVSPELVPVLVAAGVLMVGVAALRGRLQYSFEFEDTEAGRERRYLQDALISRVEGKELRLFDSSGLLLRRHEDLSVQRYDQLRKLVKQRVLGAAVANVALAMALTMCLVVVSVQASSGNLSLADAAVAILATYQMASRLLSISASAGSVLQARLFVTDIVTFLSEPDATEALAAAGRARSAPPDANCLVLDRVTYRYPGADNDALADVSLRVETGEIVALVGENGAGKSTLAKVAAGLYPPCDGEVRVDDATRAIDAGPLAMLVSAVFQDFARYELSVRENVRLGAPWLEPDNARIERAIEAAGATELVAALPGGLETRLGKRFGGGTDLSLGQWQRLAIARAVFSDARFLIFDEPTSWLDGESAGAFPRLLRELAKDRGILVISHRPETCAAADRVVHLGRPGRALPGAIQVTTG